MKSYIAPFLLVVAGIIVMVWCLRRPQSSLPEERNAEHSLSVPAEIASEPSSRVAVEAAPETVAGSAEKAVGRGNIQSAKSATRTDRMAAKLSTAKSNRRMAGDEPGNAIDEPIVPEKMARVALDYVGADPEAEAVWMTAINDPNLDDKARQNLIEDLNENGISDPDHPTMDDLPLIESRLVLIEDIGSDAMDDVNAAAFQEAYKDLLNMDAKLTGR